MKQTGYSLARTHNYKCINRIKLCKEREEKINENNLLFVLMRTHTHTQSAISLSCIKNYPFMCAYMDCECCVLWYIYYHIPNTQAWITLESMNCFQNELLLQSSRFQNAFYSRCLFLFFLCSFSQVGSSNKKKTHSWTGGEEGWASMQWEYKIYYRNQSQRYENHKKKLVIARCALNTSVLHIFTASFRFNSTAPSILPYSSFVVCACVCEWTIEMDVIIKKVSNEIVGFALNTQALYIVDWRNR